MKPSILKFIAPYQSANKEPEIVFSMGEENILSRIKNTFFSPVRVDVALGKGQLSYDELNSLQVSLKVKPAKLHFYLAGSGVSRSPAPGSKTHLTLPTNRS